MFRLSHGMRRARRRVATMGVVAVKADAGADQAIAVECARHVVARVLECPQDTDGQHAVLVGVPHVGEQGARGRDLIEHGWKPGPRFRTVLQAVEDAQLEGVLRSREEAMSFVETNFPIQD